MRAAWQIPVYGLETRTGYRLKKNVFRTCFKINFAVLQDMSEIRRSSKNA